MSMALLEFESMIASGLGTTNALEFVRKEYGLTHRQAAEIAEAAGVSR